MAASGAENAVEEDAADLVFPPEFEKADTKTLLISEVHILLEHRKQVKYKSIVGKKYRMNIDSGSLFSSHI